tara:strand:- start:641 stop:1483 length:843 start_codon:yes stop_codon:yes gene_type:complete
MCGGYGDADSNEDGKVGGFLDFFADITDGGGKGRSGARFSSGDTGGLDQNQDNYISEQEYQRGQSNSESNADSNITSEIGDAYNNSQNIISRGSNIFGALPRGSIRREAALGSDGRDISTSGAARFMQGFAGDARNMAMAPVRAYMVEGAPPNPVGNPEQQARSYDSLLNTGSSQFYKLPEAQRRAIIEGTQSLNPLLGRAMSMPANVGSIMPVSLPKNVVAAGDQFDESFPNEDLRDISNISSFKVYATGQNDEFLVISNGEVNGTYSGKELRDQNIIN